MYQDNKRFIKILGKWIVCLSVLGLTCYPIIIAPMIDASEYKKIQKITRKDVDQEKIQPGNMKVWTDPFDRKY